jgi:hypothetical protein
LVQPLHQIIATIYQLVKTNFLLFLYLLLYADDTVIFAETAAEFQSALNAMYLYCETWKLQPKLM